MLDKNIHTHHSFGESENPRLIFRLSSSPQEQAQNKAFKAEAKKIYESMRHDEDALVSQQAFLNIPADVRKLFEDYRGLAHEISTGDRNIKPAEQQSLLVRLKHGATIARLLTRPKVVAALKDAKITDARDKLLDLLGRDKDVINGQLPNIEDLARAQKVIVYLIHRNSREQLSSSILLKNKVNPLYKDRFTRTANWGFKYDPNPRQKPRDLHEYFPGNKIIYIRRSGEKKITKLTFKSGEFKDKENVGHFIQQGDEIFTQDPERITRARDNMHKNVPFNLQKYLTKTKDNRLKLNRNVADHFVDFFMSQKKIRVYTRRAGSFLLVYNKQAGEFIVAEEDRAKYEETREFKRRKRKGITGGALYRHRFMKGDSVMPVEKTEAATIPKPVQVQKLAIKARAKTVRKAPPKRRSIAAGYPGTPTGKAQAKNKPTRKAPPAPRRIAKAYPKNAPKGAPQKPQANIDTVLANLRDIGTPAQIRDTFNTQGVLRPSITAIQDADEWNRKVPHLVGLNSVMGTLNKAPFKNPSQRTYTHEDLYTKLLYGKKQITARDLDRTFVRIKHKELLKAYNDEHSTMGPNGMVIGKHDHLTIEESYLALHYATTPLVKEHKALSKQIKPTTTPQELAKIGAKIVKIANKLRALSKMKKALDSYSGKIATLLQQIGRLKFTERRSISRSLGVYNKLPKISYYEASKQSKNVHNIRQHLPSGVSVRPEFGEYRNIFMNKTAIAAIRKQHKTVPLQAVISMILMSYSADELIKMGCVKGIEGAKGTMLITKIPQKVLKNIPTIAAALEKKNKDSKTKTFNADKLYELRLKLVNDKRFKALMQLERIFSLKHLGPKMEASLWTKFLRWFSGKHAIATRNMDQRDIVMGRTTTVSKKTKFLTHTGRHAHLKILDLVREKVGDNPEAFLQEMQRHLNDMIAKGLLVGNMFPSKKLPNMLTFLQAKGIDLTKPVPTTAKEQKAFRQKLVALGVPMSVLENYNIGNIQTTDYPSGKKSGEIIAKTRPYIIYQVLMKHLRGKFIGHYAIDLKKPISAKQVKLVQAGFVWAERIRESAQRMQAHPLLKSPLAGLQDAATRQKKKLPQKEFKSASTAFGRVLSSKKGVQMLVYGRTGANGKARVTAGGGTHLSTGLNIDTTTKADGKTIVNKAVGSVVVNQGIIQIRTKTGYFSLSASAGATVGAVGGKPSISGIFGLSANAGGTLYADRLRRLNWSVSFTPIGSNGIPDVSGTISYSERVSYSDFAGSLGLTIGIGGVSVTAAATYDVDHAINRRLKAKLEKFGAAKIIKLHNKPTQMIAALRKHPQMGPAYDDALKYFKNPTQKQRIVLARTLLQFYSEQVRNGVVKNLKVPLIVSGGITLVNGILPIPFIAFRIGNQTIAYRTISTKASDAVSDAHFVAAARRGGNSSFTSVRKLPLRSAGNVSISPETGRRKLERASTIQTQITFGDTLEMYNTRLREARIRMAKVPGRPGMLQLHLQSSADRKRIYLDPALKGKVSLIYEGTKIYLAFKPGTSVYMSRSDVHYPYQRRGSSHDTFLYIKAHPATNHRTIRRAENGTMIERFSHAGRSYTGLWQERGSRGHVDRAAMRQNYIMPLKEFQAKKGLDRYQDYRVDFTPHAAAHNALMQAITLSAKEKAKAGAGEQQLTSLGDKIYNKYSKLYKYASTIHLLEYSGNLNASANVKMRKLISIVQREAKSKFGKPLSAGQLRFVFMHIMHRSFYNRIRRLNPDSTEREKKRFNKRLERMLKGFARRNLEKIFKTQLAKPAFKAAMAKMGLTPKHAATLLTHQFLRTLLKGDTDFRKKGKLIPAGFMIASLVGTSRIYGLRYMAQFGGGSAGADRAKFRLINMAKLDINSTDIKKRTLARLLLNIVSPVPSLAEAGVAPDRFLQTPLALKMAQFATFKFGPKKAKMLAEMFSANRETISGVLRKPGYVALFKEYHSFVQLARRAQYSGKVIRLRDPKGRWTFDIKPSKVDVRSGLYMRCGNPTFIANEQFSGTLYVPFQVKAHGNRFRQASYVRAKLGKSIGAIGLSGYIKIVTRKEPPEIPGEVEDDSTVDHGSTTKQKKQKEKTPDKPTEPQKDQTKTKPAPPSKEGTPNDKKKDPPPRRPDPDDDVI